MMDSHEKGAIDTSCPLDSVREEWQDDWLARGCRSKNDPSVAHAQVSESNMSADNDPCAASRGSPLRVISILNSWNSQATHSQRARQTTTPASHARVEHIHNLKDCSNSKQL